MRLVELTEGVVIASRVLSATSGIMAFWFAFSTARADIKFNVCMGNGGGPSCSASGTVTYTCAQYNAIGGGADATYKALGDRFCKYYDANGQQQQMPYSVVHLSSVAGGQCGWTLFTVTCLTPK
jgi:hypothetical protein